MGWTLDQLKRRGKDWRKYRRCPDCKEFFWPSFFRAHCEKEQEERVKRLKGRAALRPKPRPDSEGAPDEDA